MTEHSSDSALAQPARRQGQSAQGGKDGDGHQKQKHERPGVQNAELVLPPQRPYGKEPTAPGNRAAPAE
jgi:hypothetical protein